MGCLRAGRLWMVLACGLAACSAAPVRRLPADAMAGAIPAYQPRSGHARPVIAIVANNRGAELSDLLVPYGILSRDSQIDVQLVSLNDGEISTFTDMGLPGPRFRAETTLQAFDAHFPEGADYVVVPAQASSPALIGWLSSQARKGGTLVSICNGALIVAKTGLFDGRFATAHWSTEDERLKHYPGVRWVRDRRYVADGGWISTTGVSAAIPASLALIEAIHGRDEAQRIAADLGVADWSPAHQTSAFQPHLSGTAWPLAKVAYTNVWFHHRDAIDVSAADGVDEVALALTLDAYASSGRSQAFVNTKGAPAVRTHHGLTLLPDVEPGHGNVTTIEVPSTQAGRALDSALDGIMQRYGEATAKGVALVFEYPRPPHP